MTVPDASIWAPKTPAAMRIERVLHRSRPADLTHRELYRIATIKLICAPATAPVLGKRPISPLERQGHLVGARRSEVDLVGKARIGKRGVGLVGEVAHPEREPSLVDRRQQDGLF